MKNDGFLRIAAATPHIRVADCASNKAAISALLRAANEQGVSAIVFPELCLTGYTCGDLFHDTTLLQAAERALRELIEESASYHLLAVVGLPAAFGASLYNVAAVFCRGKLLGLTAKSHIPNYSEFYEARHFSPAPDMPVPVTFCGQETLLGRERIYSCADAPEFTVGVEICEDLWVPEPPSSRMAQCGATVLLNPSASDEVIGKANYRRSLVRDQSARLFCAYAYADAGEGESSTDLVFAGHDLLAENGAILAESQPFTTGLVTAEVDLQRLVQERRRANTWADRFGGPVPIPFSLSLPELTLTRPFARLPFVPQDAQDLSGRCEMILHLQASGLKTRLAHTGVQHAVVGLSGGLDSTLALLVTVRAFDALALPRKGILAVTMPGFGTTGRTKGNAEKLAELLGVDFCTVPIGDAVSGHFQDIGHDPTVHDVTYENAQARERTQILMDLANQNGGLVIGTGDLSELALGWATYNGDHMSMYAVNASVPKTLVRHLVHYAAQQSGGALCEVLEDILDTPVSPELLPPVDGVISQKTESLVGPYELHDFFLYHMLRFGFPPSKIYRMALRTFSGTYDAATIYKWLYTFYRRFFAQQFKRSCLPDGPKVGTVALSPRGDWRMPSDASARLWLEELEALSAE